MRGRGARTRRVCSAIGERATRINSLYVASISQLTDGYRSQNFKKPIDNILTELTSAFAPQFSRTNFLSVKLHLMCLQTSIAIPLIMMNRFHSVAAGKLAFNPQTIVNLKQTRRSLASPPRSRATLQMSAVASEHFACRKLSFYEHLSHLAHISFLPTNDDLKCPYLSRQQSAILLLICSARSGQKRR